MVMIRIAEYLAAAIFWIAVTAWLIVADAPPMAVRGAPATGVAANPDLATHGRR